MRRRDEPALAAEKRAPTAALTPTATLEARAKRDGGDVGGEVSENNGERREGEEQVVSTNLAIASKSGARKRATRQSSAVGVLHPRVAKAMIEPRPPQWPEESELESEANSVKTDKEEENEWFESGD